MQSFREDFRFGVKVVASIDHHVGFDNLQKWGEDAVSRFERHQLKLDGKCDYYADDVPKIAASEIPASIASLSSEIGICEGGDWVTDRHVPIAWYGSSLLVGRRDLAFEGEPQTLVYLRVLRPGVIFTSWDVK